jgi:Reverse transcriptase (RNA-dependent DNA polymerase)
MKRHTDADEYTDAAQVEVRQLEAKGTFVTVDRPKDRQILPLKWVFTHKLDTAGYLMHFKARICVRGDLQMDSGNDLYAATSAYRTFRILIAFVAAFNLIYHSIDVTNAFLNALLSEEVFVKFPPGFTTPGKIWKLNEALYGLRIAPKLWFKEISTLKIALHNKYGIKDLGPATSFLNIKITRDAEARKAWISQETYIDKLISTFHLQAMLAHPIKTPLPRDLGSVPYEGQATESQIQGCQRRTGPILYLAVASRPDIACTASVLCQFN